MSASEPKLGLRTCIYKVSDLKAAIAWYSKLFNTEPYFQNENYIGYSIGGFELGLMPDPLPADQKPTNVLTYWGVEDLERAVEEMVAEGATIDGPIVDVGGGITLAELKDPWGNLVGLIRNPEFKLT